MALRVYLATLLWIPPQRPRSEEAAIRIVLLLGAGLVSALLKRARINKVSYREWTFVLKSISCAYIKLK